MNSSSEDLVTELERATHAAGIALEERLEATGISQAEAHVLRFLARHGAAAINDIHRSFGHRRSTLTSVLDRLERRGLVRRMRHPTSRRSVLVRLTPGGDRAGREVVRAIEEIERRVRARVTPGDRRGFQAVIAALGEAVSYAHGGEGRDHPGRRA
jgi:DNA-binding MarR family transcriptional regulator